jgi:hypothetical protein
MNNQFTILEIITLLALAMGFQISGTYFVVAMITAWGLNK